MQSKSLAGIGTVSYTYDNIGLNETAQISGGAGIVNEYDGFGSLKSSESTASTGSLKLKYEYDEDGNRKRVEWPDGTYVQYTYDGLDRMDEVRENGASSGPGRLAKYSYDAIGRRSYLTRGNGTITYYGYDAGSRLSSVTQDLASTSRDLTLGLSYNPASQVTQRTLTNDAYSYFALTRSTSYTRNGLNRYTAVGGVTYGYDGRGNLTSDGTRTLAYDLENHLLSVTGGTAPINLTYDPNGRLLTSTSGGITTRYLYDGDQLVAEYNGSTLLRRYVHGVNADEPLVWYEGAGLTDRRWLHTDHLGSVISSSNGSGVSTVYSYGAYGEPAYDNWSGSRFRYTGQIMLPEAKLYHYKARVYDPSLGRFLQTDPVGYKDGLNFYAYVGNDPLNNMDPTGAYTCQDDAVCDSVEDALREAAGAVKNVSDKADRARLKEIIAAYGKRGVDNKVVVKTKEIDALGRVETDDEGVTTVTLNNSFFAKDAASAGASSVSATVVHEGSHLLDAKSKVYDGGPRPTNAQQSYDTERRAYGMEGVFRRATGMSATSPNHPYALYDPSWESGPNVAGRMASGARQRAWYGSWCKQGGGVCKGVKAW